MELARDMSRLSGISIAKVVPDLSTQDVLTTEWVNGEKLSESQAEDVRTLCNTLLNAYLIQLLETGFLHADPHPGERSRVVLLLDIEQDQVVLLLYWLAVDWCEQRGIVPVLGVVQLWVGGSTAGWSLSCIVQPCTGERTMNQLRFLLRTPIPFRVSSMALVYPAS